MKAVRKLSDKVIAKKMLDQQRALEAGKLSYKMSDQILDELEQEVAAGNLKLDDAIDLGNGQVGRLVDRFAEKNKVGYGGACRRFEVKVSRADDIAKKL